MSCRPADCSQAGLQAGLTTTFPACEPVCQSQPCSFSESKEQNESELSAVMMCTHRFFTCVVKARTWIMGLVYLGHRIQALSAPLRRTVA